MRVSRLVRGGGWRKGTGARRGPSYLIRSAARISGVELSDRARIQGWGKGMKATSLAGRDGSGTVSLGLRGKVLECSLTIVILTVHL